MGVVKTFRDLIVWQKSMDLVVKIYKITNNFPSEEKFGIISQLRRAAVSVSSNIAEGFGRNSSGSFANFLNYSMGSLMEVETQLEISKRIEFISEDIFNELYEDCREVERLLSSFKKSVEAKK